MTQTKERKEKKKPSEILIDRRISEPPVLFFSFPALKVDYYTIKVDFSFAPKLVLISYFPLLLGRVFFFFLSFISSFYFFPPFLVYVRGV